MADPQLPPDPAESIFAAWIARCDADESTSIDELCAAHPAQATRLRALAARLREFDRALGPPPRAPVHESTWFGHGQPPSKRYESIEALGRGGMGEVFAVRDLVLPRTLAMKVATTPFSDPRGAEPASRASRRFLREAEILAELDHPGIVPIHDLGVRADGRAFFTMRRIAGRDLRAVFADVAAQRNGWSTSRALSVVVRVCETMAFAHSRGVIHRDLKPANVMVGAFGEVYVVDWGLARRAGVDPTGEADETTPVPTDSSESSATASGEVLGTPAYMPPEQARGDAALADQRSDVYSIGAMLYHLLAGEAPYGRVQTPAQLLANVISTPPPALAVRAPSTPADLLAIVDKAMARAPELRYGGAQELGADLQAFLERRVVSAYETGAWAQTRKWIARNRALAGALALALTSAVLGAAAFAHQARSAERARDEALAANVQLDVARRAAVRTAEEAQRSAEQARAARQRAEQIRELFVGTLASSDPAQGGEVDRTVSAAMDDAIAALERGELREDPGARASLQMAIATVLNGLGRFEDSLELSDSAAQTLRELQPSEDEELAVALGLAGQALRGLGRVEAALERQRESLEVAEQLTPPENEWAAAAHNNIGVCLLALGRGADAIDSLLRSVELHRVVFAGQHAATAASLTGLGDALVTQGRLREALEPLREALEMFEALTQPDDPRRAAGLSNLGRAHHALGEYALAGPIFERCVEMLERVYPQDHPLRATALGNLGACLQALGRPSEGLPHLRAGLAMQERLLDSEHPAVIGTLTNLAACLFSLQRFEEALPYYERSADLARRVWGQRHPYTPVMINGVAECLRALGRVQAALPLYEEAVAAIRVAYPDGHPNAAALMANQATALLALQRGEEALALQREVLDMRVRIFGESNESVATSHRNIAATLQGLDRNEEALESYRAALEIHRALEPGGGAAHAQGLYGYAAGLSTLGRHAEALEHAEQAAAMAREHLDPGHSSRTRIEQALPVLRANAGVK